MNRDYIYPENPREAISLVRVCCGYGKKFMLREINLKIHEGEFVSVIGPNGSGKTTMLRGITGLLPVSEGRILIGDQDLSVLTYRERATRMAVVNQ